jgi:hypothetical protein
MAISPNDDFTAGQVLTATECNQFPRGVMALATVNDLHIRQLTLVNRNRYDSHFTAVSTVYKITYYEPYK